jgi:hypothetical protein
MANTVGKISGQMLESNLLRRDMQSGDENLAFETDLLYLDVFNNRVGVNTDTPFRQLLINQDFKTEHLVVDNLFTVPNFEISGNLISNTDGNILIESVVSIGAGGIATEGIIIDAGFIKSRRSNEDIDLIPAGSGEIQFYSNVEVNGSLHATGNITFDGSVVLGDDDTDNIVFAADLAGDLVPDLDLTYSLGNENKKFSNINTLLVNGIDYTASGTVVGGVDLALRPGNIWFVAENGDNAFTGDHENGPFRTVEYALSQATAGDTIVIYPGTYMEYWPLVIPAGVTIKGSGIRSTKIIPQAATNDQDAFLLNGETSVSDLTIANFFYNSTTNTGYAFKFDNNFTVTSKSPYIQNISVITENESSLASAGRGAYIDGSVANAASEEASMLFHSATFITPDADCIIMKNGVRVEWLNCFIYFANIGLYAETGLSGFASLGLKYGAEVRSIGSANVYGNYGAWADGDFTLMYLINHNFAYIGTGLDSNNDPSAAIQANEVVQLNNGKIYYQSVDHKGNFRVGDKLLIEQTTGAITFTSTSVTATNLTVTDGTNTSYIDKTEVTTGNITFSGNTIQSNAGAINFAPTNSAYNLNANYTGQSLTTDNLTISQNIIFGSNSTNTTAINAQISSSIVPTSNYFDLGLITNKWRDLYGSALLFEDIRIDTNVISTTLSNSNLDLDANGTGSIVISDSASIYDDFTINGITNFSNTTVVGNITTNDTNINNFLTAVKFYNNNILFEDNFISTVQVNDDLNLYANGTGFVNVTDSLSVDQSFTVSGTTNLQTSTINEITINGLLNVSNTVQGTILQTDNILINDNFISTTVSNSSLELRADGTGFVNITDSLSVDQSFTVNGTTNLQTSTINGITTINGILNISDTVQGTILQTDNILINDNFISTTVSNSSLELRADGTGFVNITDSLLIDQSFTVSGTTNLQTSTVNGLLDIDGTVNVTNTFQASALQTDDILIDDNFITTTLSNSSLELRSNLLGGVIFDQTIKFFNGELSNILVSGTESERSIIFQPITGQSVNINANTALRLPLGNDTTRLLSASGEVRFNNITSRFEGRLSSGNRNFFGLFDIDANTGITAELTIGNNDDTIRMLINGTTQATINNQSLTINNRLVVDQLRFDSNIISTFNSNADLELDRSGTGVLQFKDDLTITNNRIQNIANNAVTQIISTGTGYVKFDGNTTIIIPTGTNAQRPAGTPTGATRWNIEESYLEVWNGSTWIVASGGGATISESEMGEISDEWALILG